MYWCMLSGAGPTSWHSYRRHLTLQHYYLVPLIWMSSLSNVRLTLISLKERMLDLLQLQLTLVSIWIPIGNRTPVRTYQYILTLRTMHFQSSNFCTIVCEMLNWLSILEVKQLWWWLISSTGNLEEIRTILPTNFNRRNRTKYLLQN